MTKHNFSRMHPCGNICKRKFLPIIIFFCICLPLFCFQSVVVGGTVVSPPHETGDGHHPHALKSVDAVADLETTPKHVSAHTLATLQVSFKDREGKPLSGITISHERILHVIIVSEDFTVFAHLHPEDFGVVTPEMIRDATFSVKYSFPKAGRYLIAMDSAVHDQFFAKQRFIDVKGEPKMAVTEMDFSHTKKFGDYVIRFTAPGHIKAGQDTTLGYFIEREGKPVSDLEPYLSAPMHLAVVKTDLKKFIHTHGEVPASSSAHPGHMHGTSPHGFGPRIEAHVTFPVKGMYQIFSEIQHRGTIVVASFMVDVE